MIILYGKPSAGSAAPMAVFEALGLEYHYQIADRDSADYRKIHPLGWIPTVVWEDDTTMTESAAIIVHTLDRFDPEHRLSPKLGTPARGRFFEWLFFLATQVYPTYQRLYQTRRIATEEHWDHVHAMARIQQAEHWDALESCLGISDWLAGDTFSAADIYLLMLASWWPDVPDLCQRWPNIARVCKAALSDDYVERAFLRHEQAGEIAAFRDNA